MFVTKLLKEKKISVQTIITSQKNQETVDKKYYSKRHYIINAQSGKMTIRNQLFLLLEQEGSLLEKQRPTAALCN